MHLKKTLSCRAPRPPLTPSARATGGGATYASSNTITVAVGSRALPRDTLGNCATLSSTLAVRDAAGAVVAVPRYVSGSPIPSGTGRYCESRALRTTVAIGPFTASQCGSYTLDFEPRARPTNGTSADMIGASLLSRDPLRVVGCPVAAAAAAAPRRG